MINIYKILIICSSQKGIKIMTDNLRELGYTNIDTEKNGAAARRKLIADDYDLVIIDTPLQDEIGTELAIKIAAERLTSVLVTAKVEGSDIISVKLQENGVYLLTKPFPKILFYQAIKFSFTSMNRLKILKKEQVKLKDKVEDIRVINRAKCLLIQYGEMTEQQAHRYLEKQAMDERISRRDVAEKVINYYEV